MSNPFDMQTTFDNMMLAARDAEMKTSNQLTLGDIILLLKPLPSDALVKLDRGDNVKVGKLDSWRGIYRELAFSYSKLGSVDAVLFTVEEILADCQAAVGKTFEGYKGGDFIMGRQTPCWIANYGECGFYGDAAHGYIDRLAVVGIEMQGDECTFLTEVLEG